jgi:hypothetical protein
MKHRMLAVIGLLTVAGILCVGIATGVSKAHHWGFSNEDLRGVYIFQATGTNLSHPNPSYRGPFAVNGIIWADGQGNIKRNQVVSYNGYIVHPPEFASTYQVNPDGTFTETFNSGYATVTYEGVLAKNGKEARLIVSTDSAEPTNTGMVISGSMIRQDEDSDGHYW